MTNLRSALFSSLLATILFSAPPTAFGQIEITISGAYQASTDQPLTFTERTKSDFIDQQRGQEASFIFGRTPSITFYSDSGSQQGYSYLRLRGIDQTRINVTLDGVPLNEPEDQGVYFSNFPDLLSSISRFQIIRGVGSTQNGAASYAGSILLESPELGAQSPELGVGGGSFGSARVHAQYAGQVSDTQAVYLRAAELHSDGYRRRSGNNAQSLFYKWGNLDKRNHWALSGFVGHQQNELAYIGSTPEELSKDRRHNGNSEEDDVFTQSLTQIQNVRTLKSGDVLTTSVYYNHLQGNYDFDLNNFLGLPSSQELYNYALRSHFVGAFSNYRMNFDQSRFTFGAHANRYEREHLGSERTIGELYENKGIKGELSAFGKLEQRMGDFLFLGDLQLRHTDFDYRGSVPLQGLNWTFLNPKAGLTYFPTSKTDIYYSIGSTGREPTRNDMFLGNDDLLSDDAGNPLLGSTGSERVIDHELGMRIRSESWSLQTNAFYLNFDDEFVLNGKLGPTGLPLTESVERSYRTGLEAEVLWAIGRHLTFSSSATLMRSRIHDEGVTIVPVLSPSFVSNHALEYRWEKLRARTDLRFQSGSYIDFANSASLGNSVVLDLSLHYDLSPLELGLHLTNITNERSYTNGYVDFGGSERYFVRAPTGVFVTATWKL